MRVSIVGKRDAFKGMVDSTFRVWLGGTASTNSQVYISLDDGSDFSTIVLTSEEAKELARQLASTVTNVEG